MRARMENGEWRVESGEWRVESREWRVKSEEWRERGEVPLMGSNCNGKIPLLSAQSTRAPALNNSLIIGNIPN
jgi:hypothetical protein